jgi:hypothetical protein
LFADTGREVTVNLAIRRTPKPCVTIKYLEPDFAKLFMQGLRGLAPDATQDTRFHGRELARNAAVGGLALATGLRLQEFTYLLIYEIPALPPKPTTAPIPFPVPSGVTGSGLPGDRGGDAATYFAFAGRASAIFSSGRRLGFVGHICLVQLEHQQRFVPYSVPKRASNETGPRPS